MKRAKVLLLAVASLLVLSSATVFANGNVWWEWLSQTQRNQQIVNFAWQYVGWYGGTCKVWVANMVNQASQGHVTLPPNNYGSSDYYWQYDPYGHAISMSIPIESAQSGNVVQMHLRSTNGPHTAIIYAINSSSITFIESNWFQDSNPNTVHVRTVSISDFKAQVSGYTVYPIH